MEQDCRCLGLFVGGLGRRWDLKNGEDCLGSLGKIAILPCSKG